MHIRHTCMFLHDEQKIKKMSYILQERGIFRMQARVFDLGIDTIGWNKPWKTTLSNAAIRNKKRTFCLLV